MKTAIGKWYKFGNNYEELSKMEPFSIDELNMVADVFKKLYQKLEDNKIKVEQRDKQVVDNFMMKAVKRLSTSQQDVQEDYEHANQVDPASIVTGPKGGFSDKTQTQQNMNNNGGANVSTT